MWVRLTFVKIQPDKVDELRKVYYEEVVPVVKAQKGIVDIFLMEPIDEDEDFISLTSWDSKANGDTYEASGTYLEMVNKVKFGFVATPTLKSYEVKN